MDFTAAGISLIVEVDGLTVRGTVVGEIDALSWRLGVADAQPVQLSPASSPSPRKARHRGPCCQHRYGDLEPLRRRFQDVDNRRGQATVRKRGAGVIEGAAACSRRCCTRIRPPVERYPSLRCDCRRSSATWCTPRGVSRWTRTISSSAPASAQPCTAAASATTETSTRGATTRSARWRFLGEQQSVEADHSTSRVHRPTPWGASRRRTSRLGVAPARPIRRSRSAGDPALALATRSRRPSNRSRRRSLLGHQPTGLA
ncbi:hypothetical protein GQR58_030090 [Nymphon striatum]|nr:hypothetical protein GQR58_030090 [Nymphon striatum]